jgi:hypothetical protein
VGKVSNVHRLSKLEVLPCYTVLMMVRFTPYISMKGSHDPYDDVVVEVRWVESVQTFQIVRIRDDKRHGNHKAVVAEIIEYIKHGVSETEVGRLP